MSLKVKAFIDKVNKVIPESASFACDPLFKTSTRFSSGSLELDLALGGGWPRSRIFLLYGPESCLSKDTFIPYSVIDKEGKVQNHKGGTIENLYNRFHGLQRKGKGSYQRPETMGSSFVVPSIDEDDRIFRTPVVDVVDCGRNDCFRVSTIGGHAIECTAEHKFYVGEGRYLKLSEMEAGSILYVHNNTHFKKKHEAISYTETTVKFAHPRGYKKRVNGCDYHRIRKSFLVFEADKNGLSYEEYKEILNRDDIKERFGFFYVPKGYTIHHKDGNSKNDSIENLELMEAGEHLSGHMIENHQYYRYVAVEDVIDKIEPIGRRQLFDIKCIAPYNNYVASNFIVHNCGKTMIATKACASVNSYCRNCHQKMEYCKCTGDAERGVACVIDVEGCVAKGEHIFLPEYGTFVPIEEMIKNKIQSDVLSEFDGKALCSKIENWYENGEKRVLKISTANGESVSVTENHRMLIYDKESKCLIWKRSDELSSSDWLTRPRNLFLDFERSDIDRDLISFLGYMLGDGYFDPSACMSFTNIDKEVLDEMTRICRRFGAKLTLNDDRHYRISGIEKANRWHPLALRTFVKEQGLIGVTKERKHIPIDVWQQKTENLKGLVVALFMTDGTVNKSRASLSFSNNSLELLMQLRMLLRRFGIHSTLKRPDLERYDKTGLISINGIELLKFYETFRLLGRKQRLLESWYSKYFDGAKKRLPKQTQGVHFFPTDEDVRKKVENDTDFVFDRIVSIEDGGLVETFDLTINETHNFVVNDFVAHNTFDVEWAQKLGFDTTLNMVFKPECGEQAVDVTTTAINEGIFDAIVFDSIAMAVPTVELEKSAEEGVIGRQALMMNRAFRKWQSALNGLKGRGPSLFCLNQPREKIGVMFGDTMTLPAGKGQRFANSIELRMKTGKYHDVPKICKNAYVEISGTTAKNKTYPAKEEFLFHLSVGEYDGYEQGDVNNAESIIKYCRQLGLIKCGKGEWFFSYGDDEIRAKGKDELVKILMENQDIHDTLWEYVLEEKL